jgi:polyhydroxybutyrate depolymerase
MRCRFTLRPVVAGIVLMLSLTVAQTAAAEVCGGSPGPTGQVDLTVGGAMRTFVVRVPAKYDARTPAPVVFLFHPFGMNTQYMQGRVPLPRVWPEAIAIYGQGLPRFGSGAVSLQPSWQTKAGEMDDRDLAYFDAILDWLHKNHCVDDTRVFVMGYSNGATFTSVLACERAAVIAGVAIASGSLSCTPPQAKPIILSHGLSDQTIPYARAVDAANTWASRDGCRAPPRSGAPGCFIADSCSTAPVVLCSYDGGHEYNDPFTKALAEFFKNAVKK